MNIRQVNSTKAEVTQLTYISGEYTCPVCGGVVTTEYVTNTVYTFSCDNNSCPVKPMVFESDAQSAQCHWECLCSYLKLLKKSLEKTRDNTNEL